MSAMKHVYPPRHPAWLDHPVDGPSTAQGPAPGTSVPARGAGRPASRDATDAIEDGGPGAGTPDADAGDAAAQRDADAPQR